MDPLLCAVLHLLQFLRESLPHLLIFLIHQNRPTQGCSTYFKLTDIFVGGSPNLPIPVLKLRFPFTSIRNFAFGFNLRTLTSRTKILLDQIFANLYLEHVYTLSNVFNDSLNFGLDYQAGIVPSTLTFSLQQSSHIASFSSNFRL
jgi:hypothetical protein